MGRLPRARGHFILRIEDIDRARCRPAFEAQLMADLEWLGLDWDEPPTRQSERIPRYDALLALPRRRTRGVCLPL
ncbi:MAG: glutamate--tRNA ligase family protein [Myxococcota bacterium]